MSMIVNMSVLLKQIGISGYEVLNFDDSGKHSRLEVGLLQRPSRCPCCGAARLHSKGRYHRQARHLSAVGQNPPAGNDSKSTTGSVNRLW